jgi:para-aminobenzoate synthetase / 4-amino-4-deoxychorismate lyase
VRSSPHADPTRGVFETLLVLDGTPVEVEAHVERLAASVSALFGVELPVDAGEAIAQGARRIRHGRLRLTVVPKAGRMEAAVSTAEIDAAQVFPPPDRGISLRSFLVEGGLGAHKWADRRLLDRFAATAEDTVIPLLLDAGSEVLEASRANVFAVRDGTLLTPPADGRIVPGIARMRTLELARAAGQDVREERLSLDDLLAADEVFLTNSVRGVELVRSIDGRDVPAVRGPNRQRTSGTSVGSAGVGLATELRRRWLGVPRGESAAVVASGRRGGRPGR